MNLPLPTGEVDFVSERSEFTKSGEGTILKMLNATKRKCAFTLSEVLIVLAVLGVVAAMTIPDLIQDYREKALITALKKNYSIFEQAVEMAIAENGPIADWDISSSFKLYNILKPYLKVEKTCSRTGCFADHYEALFGTDYAYQPELHESGIKGVLLSGTSFWIISYGTMGSFNAYGRIFVDVNGKSGPNRSGVDLFEFFIDKENGIVPFGKTYGMCVYGAKSTYNGPGCTYWALKHENMDYLRKSGRYVGY